MDLRWLLESRSALVIALGAIASIVLSVGLSAIVLVRMPEDYFVHDPPPLRDRLRGEGTARVVAKNALGVVLVALGLVLSIPGVPGQGVLTILLGLALLDTPAKRKLELAIVRQKPVRRALARLRARFGKPPIIMPGRPRRKLRRKVRAAMAKAGVAKPPAETTRGPAASAARTPRRAKPRSRRDRRGPLRLRRRTRSSGHRPARR